MPGNFTKKSKTFQDIPGGVGTLITTHCTKTNPQNIQFAQIQNIVTLT